MLRRFCCLLYAMVLVLALPESPALAIDSARTAVSLVQQAAKAYEAGDFVRAADLYEKAFKLDPSPAYLWALARAEHLAGLNDGAIEHYRQFIASPGVEAARVPKAQNYLTEVEQEQNKGRLREAEAAARSGQPALAAELFLAAYKVAPSHHEWLFKAAVAEQMAEKFEGALQHFDSYLQLAPADAPERGQAQARETWIRQKLGLKPLKLVEKVETTPEVRTTPVEVTQPEPVKPTPKPVDIKPIETITQPEVREIPQWPGWTAIGGGAVLAAVGVVVLVGAQNDAAALKAEQAHDPGQLITGLSRETALNRASAINLHAGLGWTATGLGLAAGGFGAWWLTRHPEQTAVLLPTTTGAQLLVRF